MMGFTLSKLNMLILVTALFAIITFFMFSLSGFLVGHQAEKLLESYIKEADTVISSDSLCFKTTTVLPDFITYFGGATQAEKLLPYVVKISRISSPNTQSLNSFIMAVTNRQQRDKFLAAKRTDTTAKILIYDWDTSTDTIKEKGGTFIDPQAFPVINSFVMVKEVFRNETFLHVIPCSTEQGTCIKNQSRVGCCLKNARGVESACISAPNPNECPATLLC